MHGDLINRQKEISCIFRQPIFHGGAYAQRADHKNATDDDPKDKAATKEGIMLSNKEHISIDDLINVVEKHYDWFYIEKGEK